MCIKFVSKVELSSEKCFLEDKKLSVGIVALPGGFIAPFDTRSSLINHKSPKVDKLWVIQGGIKGIVMVIS